MNNAPHLLGSRDLAERWGVTLATVRNIAKRGEIKHTRIGVQLRVKLADVVAYEAAGEAPDAT